MTGLEDPKTIRKLWVGFYVALGGLALADPKLWDLILGHEEDPHHAAHFVVDGWPEFYVIYGFIACVAMVVISKKVLGFVLMRADTYYDSSPLDPTRDAKGRPLHARSHTSHGEGQP